MKLIVKCHDGDEFIIEVSDYNATETNKALNNHEVSTIELGGMIFHRIDIKRIIPE